MSLIDAVFAIAGVVSLAFVLLVVVFFIYALAKAAKKTDAQIEIIIRSVPKKEKEVKPEETETQTSFLPTPLYSLGTEVRVLENGISYMGVVDGVDASGDVIKYHVSPHDMNGCPGWKTYHVLSQTQPIAHSF